MTREEIVNGLEIYTVGRSNKAMVHITVEELQKFIDEIKKQDLVIDKIRAEIEQLTSRYSISKERGGMGQVEWSDRLLKESDLLQIIDKYKAESE